MEQQQSDELARRVRSTLERRNLSINAASMRLRIDRNALTRFAHGIPMSMENVEKFARGLGEDVNEWRHLAGYEPIHPVTHPSLHPFDRLQQEVGRLTLELQKRGRPVPNWGEELLETAYEGGLEAMSDEEADQLIERARELAGLE